MSGSLLTSADEFIVQHLDERLKVLEDAFEADALSVVGLLATPLDDQLRMMVEDLRQRSDSRDRLVVIVTTEGGYIETVQRIVEMFRHHYRYVGFVIPNYAFSAGTILALSGDDIYMDYYSRLGPIDPQFEAAPGRWVPALGYLKQWERLMQKGLNGTLSSLEFQLMVAAFDQAELYKFEEARNLSVMLLEQWLAAYKFKDWTETETRKQPVTQEMRKKRAVDIAKALNDTERWHSHGYGISMDVLQQELNLRIDDLAGDSTRHGEVRQYDSLLSDYMQKIGVQGIIHTVGRFRPWL